MPAKAPKPSASIKVHKKHAIAVLEADEYKHKPAQHPDDETDIPPQEDPKFKPADYDPAIDQ